MINFIDKERAIRSIVKSAVMSYAKGFSTRHLSELDDENGIINKEMHNVFIAVLDKEIQHNVLIHSIQISLGYMLESLAISISELNYKVSQRVAGTLYKEQTNFIKELLKQYQRRENNRLPKVEDYNGITKTKGTAIFKCYENNYYLVDEEIGMHYLIVLRYGGDIDLRKARLEKEALLEQYCILANKLGEDKVKILFATAYNRYGEGRHWMQGRVLQTFSQQELCIGCDFWNLVCKSERGFEIVIDEFTKDAHYINDALHEIIDAYSKKGVW